MSFIKSPAAIFLKDLASKFSGIPYFLRSSKSRKKGLEIGKPGEVIEKLSEEERKIIAQLTSEDAQNMSLNFGEADYICDEYWEKKSEEDRYKEYLEGSKIKK